MIPLTVVGDIEYGLLQHQKRIPWFACLLRCSAFMTRPPWQSVFP